VSELKKPIKGELCELPICKIIIPKGCNPRQHKATDNDTLFALGESIQQVGQLQPVIVNFENDRYVLIAGQRRIEAASAAGQKTIEAKVYTGLDYRTMLLMTIAENRHREGLNPIEEAKGMELLADNDYNDKEIAKTFGMTADTIRRRMNLLKLEDDVQRMIVRDINPLPIHQAQQLVSLSASQQLEIARKAAPITGPVATEEQVKQMVEELKGPGLDLADPEDKKPSLPIPRGSKPPKLKTGPRPPKPGKDDDAGNMKIGEVNFDITGEASLSADGRSITFKATSSFLTIGSGKGKKEIPIAEPMVVFFTNECPGVIKKIQAAVKK
jgi:ParB/RepB/Spo0J family partition protein